ncbi:MAG: spermidine synthase [Hyphomicrobiaceae bacterium]
MRRTDHRRGYLAPAGRTRVSRFGIRRLLALVCTLLPMLLAVAPASALAQSQQLVEEKSSNYNNIFVYKSGPQYILTFGHNRRFYTESIYDTRDELALPVTYTRFMTVGLAYVDAHGKLLEIGAGGGRTAWYLHKHLPDMAITSIELDPVVHQMATKYFGIRDEKNFNVVVQDGRRYLSKTNDKWNLILIDAYRGPFVPFHLLTREFYKLVESRLAPGGVVVQNVEPSTMMFDAALVTMQSVFPNVDVYPAEGNIVLVAFKGKSRSSADLQAAARLLQEKYKFKYPLGQLLQPRRIAERIGNVRPLTDDFAPVESLLAIERHNRKLDDFSRKPHQ